MGWIVLVMRVLLGLMFAAAGLAKLQFPELFVAKTTAAGLPFPELAVHAAAALELTAGPALLLGLKTRYAAIGLGGFTVLAAVLIHTFWAVEPPRAQAELVGFVKNVVITGMLTLIYLKRPGRWALDATKIGRLMSRRAFSK